MNHWVLAKCCDSILCFIHKSPHLHFLYICASENTHSLGHMWGFSGQSTFYSPGACFGGLPFSHSQSMRSRELLFSSSAEHAFSCSSLCFNEWFWGTHKLARYLQHLQMASENSLQHPTIHVTHSCICFLVPQMVKNLPAMQGTWVQSLGWEDSLEEGMATYSSILP